MIFPDDNPASAMDAGVPILGGFDGFQSIEFTDTFQSLVDKLPGAGPIGSDCASLPYPLREMADSRLDRHCSDSSVL